MIGCDRFSRSRGNGVLIIPTGKAPLPRWRCYSTPAGVVHSLKAAAARAPVLTPYFLSLLRGRKNPIHPRTLDRNKSVPEMSSRPHRITNRRASNRATPNGTPTIENRYRRNEPGDSIRQSLYFSFVLYSFPTFVTISPNAIISMCDPLKRINRNRMCVSEVQ